MNHGSARLAAKLVIESGTRLSPATTTEADKPYPDAPGAWMYSVTPDRYRYMATPRTMAQTSPVSTAG